MLQLTGSGKTGGADRTEMYSFGKTSNGRLITCVTPIVETAEAVVEIFDCTVLCGRRDRQTQNGLYRSTPQRSKVPWPESKHNVRIPEDLSTAIDIVPYRGQVPHIRWPDPEKRPDTFAKDLAHFYTFATVFRMMGLKLGYVFRSGFDWDSDWMINDQTFDDLPHHEYVGLVGEG